jgi:hypothetical protein
MGNIVTGNSACYQCGERNQGYFIHALRSRFELFFVEMLK